MIIMSRNSTKTNKYYTNPHIVLLLLESNRGNTFWLVNGVNWVQTYFFLAYFQCTCYI